MVISSDVMVRFRIRMSSLGKTSHTNSKYVKPLIRSSEAMEIKVIRSVKNISLQEDMMKLNSFYFE